VLELDHFEREPDALQKGGQTTILRECGFRPGSAQ